MMRFAWVWSSAEHQSVVSIRSSDSHKATTVGCDEMLQLQVRYSWTGRAVDVEHQTLQ